MLNFSLRFVLAFSAKNEIMLSISHLFKEAKRCWLLFSS